MNPQAMMMFMSLFNGFKQRHPKFVSFTGDIMKSDIPEGSVLELSITKPEEQKITTNIKVTKEDLELIETLKSMRS